MRIRLTKRCSGILTLIAVGIASSIFLFGKRNAVRGPAVYAGDSFGTRHYLENQITPKNVANLKTAWMYSTGDAQGNASDDVFNTFECSPILCNGKLIIYSSTGRLIALEPSTGEKIWEFKAPDHDPKRLDPHRGVSLWQGPFGTSHRYRIFCPYMNRIYAIDGQTGDVIKEFGIGGFVSLTEGVSNGRPDLITLTSPPLVVGNTIVCGWLVGDNVRSMAPLGGVKAFDVRTGELLWMFRTLGDNTRHTGGGNVWSMMSYDPENGLIYLPTGSAANDTYGGDRPGDNRHANSLVCLDSITGSFKWAQQLVHHDIWDYDVPSQPLLLDFEKNGEIIHAVAATTKQGFMFLFDRITGVPLFPIKEMPVPPSLIPGEHFWPTQPVPTKPLALTPQGISVGDAWGRNAGELQKAKSYLAAHKLGKLFTPPSFEGTLQRPGVYGGCNWSGMAYDPARRLIITTTNNLPSIAQVRRRNGGTQSEISSKGAMIIGAMIGTPYVATIGLDFERDSSLPVVKPPWGTIVAVDPLSGEIVWQKPLGYLPSLSDMPGYKGWGSPNLGGAITTSSGLIFVAGTADRHLRAFETISGRELAAIPLPAGGQSLPVIYSVGKKQFVVICCGGHRAIDKFYSDKVISFALN